MKKYFLTTLLVTTVATMTAQEKLSLDANLRVRSEYRHGQGRLFEKEAKPAFFTNQRTRLGASYSDNWLTLRFSGQHIFTWGDATQPQTELQNDFGVFEAWAGVKLNDNWALKLGRQEISYDDERLLGGLDWSQYGRFHDAALAMYEKEGWKTHIGFAYNQSGQPNAGNTYSVNSYKTMQFLRANRSWNKNSLSFLFINNGFQDLDSSNNQDGTSNMQTTGFYGKFPISSLILEASAYYQFGEYKKTDVSAYQARLELLHKKDKITTAIGFEMLSGKDYNSTSSKINSFNPLYGTAHKFNGHMDFYYLGANLQGTTGLNDLYAKIDLKIKEKGSLLFMPHVFMSNAKRADGKSYLGTELDFMYSNRLNSYAVLNIGYSHHIPSNALKTTVTHGTQNWFWLQLSIKPTLFTTSF